MTIDFPKIAYLTLAFQPVNIRHAIWNAREQSYPHNMKVLYLMHQQPFPPRMTNLKAVPFQVKEFDVIGRWAQLWYLKVNTFCHACTESITILWDEDDRFEYEYTSKAVKTLIAGNLDAAWNWDNDFVTKQGIFRHRHHEPIGTIIIKTEVLKEALIATSRSFPSLTQNGGPLDTALRKQILATCKVGTHAGVRGFFQHSKSSTKRKNHWEIDL